MNNTLTTKLVVAAISVALVAAYAPTAAASSHENFGTQVKFGDADFIPNLAALATSIIKVSYGTAGDFNDDGFYADVTGAGAAAPCVAASAVASHDIRLKSVFGKTTGSLVLDSDSSERGVLAGCTNYGAVGLAGAVQLRSADANSNGRFDAGDPVYVVVGLALPAAGLVAPSNPAGTDASGDEIFTLRLTPYQSFGAGTLVRAGDADLVAFGAAAAPLPAGSAVNWFDADLDGTFTPGDRLYISNGALGVVTPLASLHSVRLHGDAGEFGTSVKKGDADFVEQLVGPAGVGLVAAAAGSICRVPLGVPTDVFDDAYVYDIDLDATADLHEALVVPYGGRAAGTLIQSQDTIIVNAACAAAVGTGGFMFADRNNNGRYDLGDAVYYSTTATAGTLAGPGTGGGVGFTVRLTDYSTTLKAGMLVRNEDADFIAYATSAIAMSPGVACAAGVPCVSHGIFDANTDGVFSEGDTQYLMVAPGVAAPAAGSIAGLYSVRIAGPSIVFGSQVRLGSPDFKPTLSAASAAIGWNGIDFGTAGQRADDAIYLEATPPGASTAPVATFDARLKMYGTNPPGSLVLDQDSAERGGGVALGVPTIHVGDRNNNGIYDLADWVWITTAAAPPGAGLAASAGGALPVAVSLRLSTTSGGNAGTLVFAGDTDQTAYGTAGNTIAFGAGGSVAFFDADLSGGFSSGDSLYLIPAAAGLGVGSTFPLYSVRISGPLAATTQPPLGGTAPPPPPPGDTTTTPPPGDTTTPPQDSAVDTQAREDAAEAKASADEAKTAAESAQRTAQEAKTAAESARTAAEGARTAAEGTQDDIADLRELIEEQDGTPGFGFFAGLVALAGAALYVGRRKA